MTKPLRLHYAPDNASLIIRLTLQQLCLPYETVLVDRRNAAQRAPAYLALNPNATIPVLETSNGALFETAAILLWLSEHSGTGAPQTGTAARASFLKWLFWCSNTFQIDLRHFFYPGKFIGDDPAHQAQMRHMFRARLQQDLRILEDGMRDAPALSDAGPFTVLDAYIPCLIRWTKLYADQPENGWFDLQTYPTLLRMCQRAERRASTHAAQAAEGLGPTPFTAPIFAAPPEGSAT